MNYLQSRVNYMFHLKFFPLPLLLPLVVFVSGCEQGKSDASAAGPKTTVSPVDIEVECDLKGNGEASCIFRNIGNVKGEECVKIALYPKYKIEVGLDPKSQLAFLPRIQLAYIKEDQLRESMQAEGSKLSIDEINNLLRESAKRAESLAVGQEQFYVLSQTEVCSGLVDVNDVRQMARVVRWTNSGKAPIQICKTGGPVRHLNWNDICGVAFEKVKK